MTELSFAKSFLQLLDSKPSKFPATHIEDPKGYPARGAYILPKLPHPLAKRQKTSAPGSTPSLSVSLKSLRNPPLDVQLKSQPATTSILQLKEAVAAAASIPVAKIRLLYRKKPVADSKTLRDILGSEGGEEESGKGKGEVVEFSVMVIGGAAAVRKEGEEKEVGGGKGDGERVLEDKAFWEDLRGFLIQRLKDEGEGERLFRVFQGAWEERK